MKALFMLLGFVFLTTGCASVKTEGEWHKVQQFSRTSVGAEPQWIQTEEDEQRVQELVNHLLSDGMSSDDAVRIALMNNLRLQAALEEIGIAKADLVQAGLFSNPNLSGLLQFPFHGKGEFVDVGGFFVISDLWQIPLRKKVAAVQMEAALQRVNAEILAVAAEAKKAFYAYASAQRLNREMQHLNEELRRWEEHLVYRGKFGFASELDLLHAVAAVHDGKMRAARFARDLKTAEVQLLRVAGLLGVQSRKITIADESFVVPVALPPQDVLIHYALAQRPDLKLSRSKVAEADRILALEQAMIFKRVEAGASYGHEPSNENKIGPSLSLQIPLFDQNQAQIAKAAYRKRQAEKELAGQIAQVHEGIKIAYASLEALQSELVLMKDEVLPLRERAAAFAEKYFNAMQISMLPLLESRQQLLSARLQLHEAQKEYYAALTELERLTGGGIPDFLKRLSPQEAKDGAVQKEEAVPHGQH